MAGSCDVQSQNVPDRTFKQIRLYVCRCRLVTANPVRPRRALRAEVAQVSRPQDGHSNTATGILRSIAWKDCGGQLMKARQAVPKPPKSVVRLGDLELLPNSQYCSRHQSYTLTPLLLAQHV